MDANIDKCKRILIIDDSKDFTRSLSNTLEDYKVFCAATGLEGLEKAKELRPHLVLLDLKMPGIGGMEVLQGLKTLEDIPVIMMTAYGQVDVAVRAIKLGAEDFLSKPIDIEKLKEIINKFFSRHAKPLRDPTIRQQIVGDSALMRNVWEMVNKFAPSDITILLEGESGTGKDLLARSIHEMSKRNEDPFVSLDCGSFPDTLVESEFFGYEKGAFTGANENKIGLFESANGGTLFLDEISNLPLDTQAKLLRVLQNGRINHLGSKGSRPIDIDFRLITATNTDLKEMIKMKRFREDLYYRLNTVSIKLPSLKERSGDIRAIADYFLKMYNKKFNRRISGISSDCVHILKNYYWPGNVRELENVIKYSILFAEEIITPSHLPEYLRSYFSVQVDHAKGQLPLFSANGKEMSMEIKFGFNIENGVHLKELGAEAAEVAELNIIREVISKKKFNQSQLAEFLGIDPKTLRVKLKRLNILSEVQ
jgi:DNA-binding NtrC family response regulator